MPNRPERHGPTAPIKYGAVSWWLTVVCVILLAVIAAAGSVLGLLYRADAHVALGNAKNGAYGAICRLDRGLRRKPAFH